MTAPTAGQLAAIEARLTADRDDFAGGWTDQTIRDREHLLAMVRELQERLNKVGGMHFKRKKHEDFPKDCNECWEEWPCPTIAAITATEGA